VVAHCPLVSAAAEWQLWRDGLTLVGVVLEKTSLLEMDPCRRVSQAKDSHRSDIGPMLETGRRPLPSDVSGKEMGQRRALG
jgi:hypothetical protein